MKSFYAEKKKTSSNINSRICRSLHSTQALMPQASVAIVGATGAVGLELVPLLVSLPLVFSSPRVFASSRSAGKQLAYPSPSPAKTVLTVELFDEATLIALKFDFIFLAVSGSFSLQHGKNLAQGGTVVIDNSSAFRYDPAIPLVIPEINFDAISKNHQIIANPNCTTAIAAIALFPLHANFGKIKKCIVSTYQAASGAGQPGMEELLAGCGAHLRNEKVENEIFSSPLPFNCIPHIDTFQDNAYTKEEMKVVWELRKILNDEEMAVSCTAVRIPTLRAHCEAITIEMGEKITPEEARECIRRGDGVEVVDDLKVAGEEKYPMPLTASKKENVEVGRIRQSLVFGDYGLDLFVCGDQLLRGAALNAVLIAKMMWVNS